jgi:hypothetical protein
MKNRTQYGEVTHKRRREKEEVKINMVDVLPIQE